MCFGGGHPSIPAPLPPQAPAQQGAAALNPLQLGSSQDRTPDTQNSFARQALKIPLSVPSSSGLNVPN